jgi:hypothetical protein
MPGEAFREADAVAEMGASLVDSFVWQGRE